MPASVPPAMRVPASSLNRPYSFSLQPAAEGAIPQRDVVRLRPVKYCSAAPRLSERNQPQVGLKPPRRRTLDFVSPRAEHALDEAVTDEAIHHVPSAAVARMSMSPQVSTPRRRLPTAVKSACG